MGAYSISAHAQLSVQGTLNDVGGTVDQLLANSGKLTNDLGRKRRQAEEDGQELPGVACRHCG